MRPTLKSVGLTLLLVCSTTIALCVPANMGRSSVLAQSTTTQDRKAEADRLLQQGFQQMKTSQYEAALQTLEQALSLYRAIPDLKGEAKVLGNLGVAYLSLSQYEKAIGYFEQALPIFQGVKNRNGEAMVLMNLGIAYSSMSQYEKAIGYFEQAQPIFQQIKDRNGEANVLNNLGLAYLYLSQYEKAITYFEQSQPIFQQVKDHNGEAGVLMNLGIAYLYLSQYEKAITHYEQARPIFQQVKDHNDEAKVLMNLGLAYLYLSQYEKAITHFEKAQPIFQQVKDRNSEAKVLMNLGFAYFSLSQYEKAITYYEQAQPIFQQIKDRNDEAKVLVNLGFAHLSLSQHEKAITYFEKARPIFQQVKDRNGEAKVLVDLGSAYLSLSQYEKAITYYEKARPIFQQVKDRNGEAKVLTGLGSAYASLSQHEKAIAYYEQARPIFQQVKDRNGEAGVLMNLGLAYGSFSQYEKAITYYKQALPIFQQVKDRNGEAQVLNSLGLAYGSLSQYEKAIACFEQALPIYQQVKDRGGEAKLFNNLGAFFTLRKNAELAIVFYKQSVNVWETIRVELRQLPRDVQEAYTQSVAGSYRRLADLLLAKGRILEAQQVLELLKVQELKEFDRTTRAKIDNGKIELDPTEQVIVDKYGGFIAFGQKIRDCQNSQPRCADYDRLIQLRLDAGAEYDRAVKTFETAIKVRKQDDENNFLNPKNRFSGKVQEILETQPNTALIYSLVTDDKLWLVLASKGETLRQFEVKVSQAELNGAVVKFRQLMEQCEQRTCTASDTAALNAISQQLYGWLFPQSLQAELKKGKIEHLIFAPDRITRYLPMAALFDGKQYLIENYTVSTIVSAEFTNTDKPNYNPQTTTVLAAGLSNGVPPNFAPLSNVPQELAAIVQTPSTRSGIYRGLELLNQQFDFLTLQKNLSGYSILHIATHGEFVRNQADGSYILLGTGQKLPISDIKKLNDLGKIHLVVLSACQTALADRSADGVEISNVSFSFMERGVKAVIASLWSVNDASTSLLMQQFYKNLATGKMTKADALRQAQLSLLQGKLTAKDAPQRATLIVKGAPPSQRSQGSDFSQPFYWAPFILIGNSL